MKNIIVVITILLVSISSFAQQGINYKAVLKDTNGNVLSNTDMAVQFTIHESTATGTVVYQEDHVNVSTDVNGLVILNIGSDLTPNFGVFNDIDWSANQHFLQTTIGYSGGVIYFDATEFMAVPYALHAKTIKNQAFKSENGLTIPENINDDFVFGNTQLDNIDNNSNSRMFFNKGKSSFRAGRTLGDEWDDANVGNRSVAFGLNTIATGSYSTALGNRTKAESYASTAIGTYNVGGGNTNSWIDTDPLFEIGNGTATINTETRSNALTVLKNGTTIVSNKSDSEPDLILGGTSNSNENGIISSDPQYPSSDIFIESNDKVFVYLDADNNESNSAFTIVNSNDTSVFRVSENGNTNLDGELNTTSTGTANMIPLAYGFVNYNGAIMNGSGNFTVTNPSTGRYIIQVNSIALNENSHIAIASISSGGGLSLSTSLDVAIYPNSLVVFITGGGVSQSGSFSFIIYQP